MMIRHYVVRTGIALGAVLALAGPAAAQSLTFTVNSSADTADSSVGNGVCATSGGVCTLRAAIQEANAHAGSDTIAFAIGSGPQTINVGSALPAISSPVVIDGSTQPGFSGAPIVVVHGGSGDGLRLTSGGSTVRGLVINNFSGHGIAISGPGGNVVEGNFIGTDAAGTAGVGNGSTGVNIDASNDNRIGGLTAAQRNVISGNTGKGNLGGVKIDGGATGNIIQGNYIGTDVTGMLPIGNEGRGVAIHSGSNNFVGGAQPGAGNLIAANRATGVRVVSGTGNLVMGNRLGGDITGAPRYGEMSNARGVQFRSDNNTAANNLITGNLWDGVLFFDGSASNNLIYGNTITFNGFNGIGAYFGTGNRFITNSIYGNGYLGINLENQTWGVVTANDAGDGDSGTNNLQNFPVITNAVVAGGQTTVSGTLNSGASQTFLVQLYANPACNPFGHGEAQYLIGQFNVATNGSGNGSFNVVLAFPVPLGWALSATAMDPGGNTSELSACSTVH